VHADLSEYNILFHNQACHAIDFGQSVAIGHPEASGYSRPPPHNHDIPTTAPLKPL
jgi:hypothetical protein